MELDVAVHAAAERFVLGVSTATQGVVLSRGALVAVDVVAVVVGERDAAGDAIRAVLGDLDGRLRVSVVVDVVALLALRRWRN